MAIAGPNLQHFRLVATKLPAIAGQELSEKGLYIKRGNKKRVG